MDPVLAGEPEAARSVEGCGVEVCVWSIGWERKDGDLVGVGVDPDDRIEPAIGDLRRPRTVNDHTVWSRPGPERNVSSVSCGRIEPAQLAGALCGVPHTAIDCGGDIVWSRSGGHGEGDELEIRDGDRLE